MFLGGSKKRTQKTDPKRIRHRARRLQIRCKTDQNANPPCVCVNTFFAKKIYMKHCCVFIWVNYSYVTTSSSPQDRRLSRVCDACAPLKRHQNGWSKPPCWSAWPYLGDLWSPQQNELAKPRYKSSWHELNGEAKSVSFRINNKNLQNQNTIAEKLPKTNASVWCILSFWVK